MGSPSRKPIWCCPWFCTRPVVSIIVAMRVTLFDVSDKSFTYVAFIWVKQSNESLCTFSFREFFVTVVYEEEINHPKEINKKSYIGILVVDTKDTRLKVVFVDHFGAFLYCACFWYKHRIALSEIIKSRQLRRRYLSQHSGYWLVRPVQEKLCILIRRRELDHQYGIIRL